MTGACCGLRDAERGAVCVWLVALGVCILAVVVLVCVLAFACARCVCRRCRRVCPVLG